MEIFQNVQVQILGHVALAMALGALIGLEREFADKPAGMRTHMLVAGAASLLVGLADLLVVQFGGHVSGDILRTDPLRVIQAVIVGVSFIGAGTIIRRGADQAVEGLTTAAAMLFTTAMGIAIALSQFVLGIGVTAMALLTLRGLRSLESYIVRRAGNRKQKS